MTTTPTPVCGRPLSPPNLFETCNRPAVEGDPRRRCKLHIATDERAARWDKIDAYVARSKGDAYWDRITADYQRALAADHALVALDYLVKDWACGGGEVTGDLWYVIDAVLGELVGWNRRVPVRPDHPQGPTETETWLRTSTAYEAVQQTLREYQRYAYHAQLVREEIDRQQR